jgi:hypothetical protein
MSIWPARVVLDDLVGGRRNHPRVLVRIRLVKEVISSAVGPDKRYSGDTRANEPAVGLLLHQ